MKSKGIPDSKEIANTLNSHFWTTAKKQVFKESVQSQAKNESNISSLESFITKMPKTTKVFKFRNVTPIEVTKVIAKF